MIVEVGPDTYAGDGNGAQPGWSAARAARACSFVGLQAVYGTVVSTVFSSYRQQLRALGIPVVGYGFLRFGQGMPSGKTQAQALLHTVGPRMNHEPTPVLDLEMGGQRPSGVSAQQILDVFTEAQYTIKAELGVYGGTYTSRVVWVDPAQMDNPPCALLKDSWGWIKYWPYATHTPAIVDHDTLDNLPAPTLPDPFEGQWGMHQTQGDAIQYPGLIGRCDVNRMRLIAQGDTGGTVKYIQRRVGAVIDGQFGSATKAKVQAFQGANGLVADGVVGVETFFALTWVRV